MDRREIFQKYIQNSNENADEIRPYEDHDPELKAEQTPTAVEDESPEFNLMKSPSMKKEFRLVRIVNERRTYLGMFIARCKQTEVGLVGYFVVHISSSGLVKRDGRLMVGDEIVNINGRRLRGLAIAEAKAILRACLFGNGDIVVARVSLTKSDRDSFKEDVAADEPLGLLAHHGLNHADAIAIFKSIRSSPVVLHIARRGRRIGEQSSPKTRSYDDLLDPTMEEDDEE